MADESPEIEEQIRAIQAIMDLPGVKKMADADVWGLEKGLDSAKRAAVVQAISELMGSAPDSKIVYEYVLKVADAVRDLGPALVKTEK